MTVRPVNTVALAGRSVTLQCSTNLDGSQASIAWLRNPPSGDHIVDFDCQPNPTLPQYTVINGSDGRCDLVINAASLELAATYRCYDRGFNKADAELTVIGES